MTDEVWRPGSTDDDPRLDGDRIRQLAGSEATVTLVGSVHDHPASCHRARAVVDALDPDVLALELPPLALPAFEAATPERTQGNEEASPPGGEMGAAIAAATTDRVVGIDGPSLRYGATLAATLARDRPSPGTIRDVLAGVASAGSEALRCRIEAALATHTPVRPAVRQPVDHDCRPADEPTVQAADEQRQIDRARAVMDAFEPSRAARFRDDTREDHMAERLVDLSGEGDVVAVVGHGHLESIARRVRGDLA